MLARDRGRARARAAGRLGEIVARAPRRRSARAPLLPWGGSGPAPRVSPVEASARYLMHLRDAWNATMASGDDALRLERQSIVLTVPASFDEEARELTVEAARGGAARRR